MMSPSLDSLFLSLLRPHPDLAAQQAALAQLSAADGDALVAKAVDQAVVGLVYQSLQALPAGTVPTAVLTPLRAASQRAARFNLALVKELTTILAALNNAAIPVIVLKGAYLAQAIYPQLHLRQMGDLDLLVPKERVEEAYTLLQTLDYNYYDDNSSMVDLEDRPLEIKINLNEGHHLTPLYKDPGLPLVELHWTLCDPEEARGFDLAAVWQRAQPASFLGAAALVLAPEDLILHLCHHAAYHHQFDMGLRGLMDISRVVHRFGPQIDWGALQRTAEDWGWQRGVYLTLALTHAMFDLSLPAPIAQLVEAIVPSPDFVYHTQALMLQPKAAHRAYTNQIKSAESYRALQELTPIQRLGLSLRQIFPPPQRMAQIYSISPSYLSPALYRHYWRRLNAYQVAKARLIADRRRDRQRWQQTEVAQPGISRHKTDLHHWLTAP